LDALAAKIVDAVRPTAKQPMRKDALGFALLGGDTFWDQQGEADPSMRNALGALSKAMRAVFPFDASPIDRIARRVKQFHKADGHYLGTKYFRTALGNRVYEILKAEKIL